MLFNYIIMLMFSREAELYFTLRTIKTPLAQPDLRKMAFNVEVKGKEK